MQVTEFKLGDGDFRWVCGLMKDAAGIRLTEAKRDLVYNRLSRRLRALKLDSFSAYRRLVETGENGEMTELVNALTTNVTSFFRESHHFDFLADQMLPEARADGRSRLRFWSAGCSTGQEPYTIAMTLAERLDDNELRDVKVLATDLDSNVLQIGSAGVYPQREVQSLPQSVLHDHFLRGRRGNEGMVRVKPDLQRLVSFKQLNLMEQWPFKGPFDVIFCRNVVIYFDKETQAELFRRFASALRPGGYLCVGHSESASGCTDMLEGVGRSVYRRCA